MKRIFKLYRSPQQHTKVYGLV